MRLKLFVLLLLSATIPVLAQTARLTGSVVDADTGSPIAGALVTLREQGITVTTGPAGDFLISNASPGHVDALVIAYGFNDMLVEADLYNDVTVNVGKISMKATESADYYDDSQEIYYDEHMLENEDDSQSIATLTGSGDNVYFNTASFNFGPMYFRYRGYESSYQEVSVNGIEMNDLIRGQFNFASLGGMTSRAFRNKTSAIGMDAAAYGFGAIGGSTNYNTITSGYAP
ncbi:MAG: carboxypeptidase-like regulatory domain-containing protein, partial [Clostridiales bacterium]|nr:carboxypeptidase-like regulatory domain-containing protein [Clostridiales bacterium]